MRGVANTKKGRTSVPDASRSRRSRARSAVPTRSSSSSTTTTSRSGVFVEHELTVNKRLEWIELAAGALRATDFEDLPAVRAAVAAELADALLDEADGRYPTPPLGARRRRGGAS